jgi:hypothetical protein
MRTHYYARFALIIAVQGVLIASGLYFSSSASELHIFATAGFVLPFIGYVLAFYRPAVAAGWSRVAFSLSIIFVTSIGFFVLLFLTFFLLMAFSGHHW